MSVHMELINASGNFETLWDRDTRMFLHANEQVDGIEAPELEVAVPKLEDEGGSIRLAVVLKTGAGESPGKFTTPILGSKAPASRAAKAAKSTTAVKAMSKVK